MYLNGVINVGIRLLLEYSINAYRTLDHMFSLFIPHLQKIFHHNTFIFKVPLFDFFPGGPGAVLRMVIDFEAHVGGLVHLG